MAAALVKLEAEEAVKNGGKGGRTRRDTTFAKTARISESDAAVARPAESTEETLDLPALGSEHGLESLLQFVPRFVQERCIEGMDMESLSDHRRVCVLFVIAHVQVIPSSIFSILAFLHVPAVLGFGLSVFGSLLSMAITCFCLKMLLA